MTVQHKELSSGRWMQMTLLEQMANIGSEVERFLSWRSRNNADYAAHAFERALELIDLTLSDPRNKSRLREIARVREMLADNYLNTGMYSSTDMAWRRYFTQFAYAARRNH